MIEPFIYIGLQYLCQDLVLLFHESVEFLPVSD